MRPELSRVLQKQGYGVVGEHAGVKLCHWTKEDLKHGRHCYKGDFYGIESRGCMQMTPIVDYCNFTCLYCWRSQSFDIDINSPDHKWDAPEAVLDGALTEQRRLTSGYKGHPTTTPERWADAQMPKHVAISLNGEPTFYPHLGEFIALCHKRGMTTFLVTNGSRPDVLKDLDPLPTQLYVSVDAPNEEVFNKLCVPLGGGAWDKLEETLDLLPSLDCRVVSRHTLVKGWNMEKEKGHIEQYAKLDRRADPDFIESKGYVFVGYSRERMTIENMPSHEDILSFTRELAPLVGFNLEGDRRESRVSLLVKPGVDRLLDLEGWAAAHKSEDHPALQLASGRLLTDSDWEIALRSRGHGAAKPNGISAVSASSAVPTAERAEKAESRSPHSGLCACGHPHDAHLVSNAALAAASEPAGPTLNVRFGAKVAPDMGAHDCGCAH